MLPPLVRPHPGVLAVERDPQVAWLRIGGAASWEPVQQKLDDWKQQLHAIVKTSLSPALREQLCVADPEDRLSAARPLLRRMLSSTPLAIVSADERARLISLGVRVYTIGYHRNPGLLRIIASGGGQPAIWIEQSCFSFYFAYNRPGARAPQLPAGIDCGGVNDLDRVDRVLRAATSGAVDEWSLLLAHMIDRNGWNELTQPEDQRRAARTAQAELREQLGDLADEDWALATLEEADFSLDRLTEGEEHDLSLHGETPGETLAMAQLLAAGELDRVRVAVDDETLTFRRERVPELLLVEQMVGSDAWFDPAWLCCPRAGRVASRWFDPIEPIWPDGPPNLLGGYLRTPASHRYVCSR